MNLKLVRSLRIEHNTSLHEIYKKNQQKIKTEMDWKRLYFQSAGNCSLGKHLKK